MMRAASVTAATAAGFRGRWHRQGRHQKESDARSNKPRVMCSRDLCQETLPSFNKVEVKSR
jgi:hypothetical protein